CSCFVRLLFTHPSGTETDPLPLHDALPILLFDNAIATRAHGLGGGEWFRSRARPAHLLRRLMSTRARIELVGHAADGAPIVESRDRKSTRLTSSHVEISYAVCCLHKRRSLV